MKIAVMHTYRLHNEEHYQFGADVLALVRTATAGALGVETAAAALTAVNREEDTVLEQIRKSALTAQIADADHARDEIWYGLSESVAAAGRHFTPAVREAAERLRIVLDTYRHLSHGGYAEQTAGLHNLLQELTTHHVDDIETLALVPWVGELDRRNLAVQELLRTRDEETTGRTDLVMKDVRVRADAAYRTLAEQVDALAVVARLRGAGAEVYDGFIASLNTLVERYELVLAQRKGRAAHRKEEAAAKKAAAEGQGT